MPLLVLIHYKYLAINKSKRRDFIAARYLQVTEMYWRNNSWKPYCVVSFNMIWRVLVFFPSVARKLITNNLLTHVKTQSTVAAINYFNSDIYNSTNTVVYFNGKDGNLYLRAMSHTIYTAKFEQTITFTTKKLVLLMEHQ